MYFILFAVAAGLNILLGWHAWPGVLAGSLNDPDSYMRLLRIEQGIHAGHLVTTVAGDQSGAGVMVEWSRLLDMLLWGMAAPMAAIIGWHRALFVAGVMLGPLGVGALGAALGWAVEPFALRRYLWSAAVAAAVLPGVLTYALPGVVHYHVLLAVLIVLTVGCVARAWRDDIWFPFLAGMSGGFAIWLTPETMPFVLMAFAALMIQWMTKRNAVTLLTCAAGCFDVLGFGLTVDPPKGGYGVPEIDRLSYVYVVMALLLLAGAWGLWRYEKRMVRWRGPIGLALMAALAAIWVAAFPQVAMGPYGIMPAVDAHAFFGVIAEQQPVRGWSMLVFLWPGALALLYAVWRGLNRTKDAPDFLAMVSPQVIGTAPRGRYVWLYLAACIAVALVLGAQFQLFVEFSAVVAAALLPVALSDFSMRFEARPNQAMLARVGVLAGVLVVPFMAAVAVPVAAAAAGGVYPSCALRDVAPLLAVAAGHVVLAKPEDAPELLYRTKVETVGSLYHHGVAGYLRDRAAWRAVPGDTVPPDVAAAQAGYVLFCPQPGRYRLVADLPATTLWDALEAGTVPRWLSLQGSDAAGWRLYRITP